MATGPATFLTTVAIGRRVVARYRIPGGFTDALGYLRDRDGSSCVIETRRGLVTVPLSAVVAAKAVPEPPPRRSPSTRVAAEHGEPLPDAMRPPKPAVEGPS